MDPISIMMGATSVIGMGMQLFGTNKAAGAASQISGESQAIGKLDMQVNAQRQQQMVLQSQRSQMQNIRNAQSARANAVSGAVSQGAQQGSGLQGGLGQISGEEGTNALANSQNLEIGQNIFGFNNQISQHRINIAALQGQQASGQGLASMGADVVKGAGALSRIGGNFFGSPGAPGGDSSGGKPTSGWDD